VRISRIPNNNGNIDLITKTFIRKGWFIATKSMPYPYIDLSKNPIKKSLKSDLCRARNRALKRGDLHMEMICSISENSLLERLKTHLKVEGSGWKGTNGTAIASSTARRRFFELFANTSRIEEKLRFCFLYIENEPVAVQFAIESMEAYWLLNIGYDERVRECSPGNLLLQKSIRAATKRGLTHYNLLGKEEPWTRRWTRTKQDCTVFTAYRPNLIGMKSMLSDAFYMLLQKPMQTWKIKSIKKSRQTF
jgi:hypothetical protein